MPLRNEKTMRVLFLRRVCITLALLLAISGAAAVAQVVYHGNAKSHVFHRPGCRYYNCGACTVDFSSHEAAVKAGYRPCKVCNP